MTKGHQSAAERTLWTLEQLDEDSELATRYFRQERLDEPLAAYLDAYDEIEDSVVTLLEKSSNLAELEAQAQELLQNPDVLDAFRYLAGPPISMDDLKVLVDTTSLAPSAFSKDPDLVARLVNTIRTVLDRRRFPWIAAGREPTEAEHRAAVVASTALIAVQRVATVRRNEGKTVQETSVHRALEDYGLTLVQIAGGAIETLRQAPKPGQFCREVLLGERKADLVVGLWDHRIMAIECKVSNSATNSVKRLNNDAAVKAEVWLSDFGTRNVVPVAVLSGVFKPHNLLNAQNRGLTLYWAHRLSDMTEWMDLIRRDAPQE